MAPALDHRPQNHHFDRCGRVTIGWAGRWRFCTGCVRVRQGVFRWPKGAKSRLFKCTFFVGWPAGDKIITSTHAAA